MSTYEQWKAARISSDPSWTRKLVSSNRRLSTNELIVRRLKSHYEGEQEEQLPERLQELLQQLDQQVTSDNHQKSQKWR